ncbi:MAG: imidazole glycerol phosphate synthase subunit HisH [Cytophagaceae bacterium]|jgi:glutamine amidotransferase|nr:imidazole glycerol phosphate synthase subunit HisH [Cytophagaceae bacterium]
MSTRAKIGIIDYDLSNLFSVMQACKYVGMNAEIVSDPDQFTKYDGLIFPGVGAFGAAMQNLERTGANQALLERVNAGIPLMGICLGMQLLFSSSEEFGDHKGLGIIPGKIVKFSTEKLRVPQIQWNKINEAEPGQWKTSPLENCKAGEFMYFVHSFYALPDRAEDILSTTEYHQTYCSSVQVGHVFACQFHPEKSGPKGLQIYENWFRRLKG